METLGARIRKLRKNQNITLEVLAGEQLTKGMLSLIENNKAKPSMESLHYIAKRLGVEVSVLLEEVGMIELRDLLKKVEYLYNNNDPDQLIKLVMPYLSNLNNGYESARILELYGKCSHSQKSGDWQEALDRAVQLYEELNLFSNLANISMFNSMASFNEHKYVKALEILQSARFIIENKSIYIEPITRIKLDYHEIMFHFAVGDSAKALRVMKSTIEFSKINGTYYRIDDLFRLASINAIIEKKEYEFSYLKEKLLQYAEFTKQKQSLFYAKLVQIIYLNSVSCYENAISLIDTCIGEFGEEKDHILFLNNELGKSLYGLNKFKEALAYFQRVKIPDYFNHPFDLSILYEKDAYTASCYLKLGDFNEAIHYTTKAYDNISKMPRNTYRDFIMDFIIEVCICAKKIN